MNQPMEVQQANNWSSGVAGCLAFEPIRCSAPEENVFRGQAPRPKKTEVTGKVTGCGDRVPRRAVLRDEVLHEEPREQPMFETGPTAGKQMLSKEETREQYREALMAQVAAKKHALMLAKENQYQGTGLQLESMQQVPMPQEFKGQGQLERARAIQLFNQQMALQKKQDRKVEQPIRVHAPRPEPMEIEQQDKAAVRLKIDADMQEHQEKMAEEKAHKMALAQNLKATLEAQMRDNEARRARDKLERRGPAHP